MLTFDLIVSADGRRGGGRGRSHHRRRAGQGGQLDCEERSDGEHCASGQEPKEQMAGQGGKCKYVNVAFIHYFGFTSMLSCYFMHARIEYERYAVASSS